MATIEAKAFNGTKPILISKWASLTHYISAKEYNALKQDIISNAYYRGVNVAENYRILYDGDTLDTSPTSGANLL